MTNAADVLPLADRSSDDAPGASADRVLFEVATSAADALRANVFVRGVLTARTCPLLTSVLRSHVTAGRRYLRVALSGADAADAAVVDSLAATHQYLTEVGGTLLVEGSPAGLTPALAAAGVHVRGAD